VETGPDPARDGVVRWRCVDLRRVIKQRFDVDLDEVSIGRTLKELGFAQGVVDVHPDPRLADDERVDAAVSRRVKMRVEAVFAETQRNDIRRRTDDREIAPAQ
jgi:hypothetical protein